MTTATRPRRLTPAEAATLIRLSRPAADPDETAAISTELYDHKLIEPDGRVCALRLANYLRKTRTDGRA